MAHRTQGNAFDDPQIRGDVEFYPSALEKGCPHVFMGIWCGNNSRILQHFTDIKDNRG